LRLFSLKHLIAYMPRRKRLRKVVAPPGFKGYKPYGANHSKNEFIELLYEEYEAINLSDYDLTTESILNKLIPYVLALSAASFIYIALADLVPQMHGKTKFKDSLAQVSLILTGILIISKGQGNFEGLINEKHPNIFFLLMAKCEPMAEMLGCNKNNLIVTQLN
jgi:hypothetical protein